MFDRHYIPMRNILLLCSLRVLSYLMKTALLSMHKHRGGLLIMVI